MSQQALLDFTQLNAVSSDFYLMISSPQKVKLAISGQAYEVSAVIAALSGFLRIWRWDKGVSGEIWFLEVVGGQTLSSDIERSDST